MLLLALLLVVPFATGLAGGVGVQPELGAQSSALFTPSLPGVVSLEAQALQEVLAKATDSLAPKQRLAAKAGAGPLGTLDVRAPVPATALVLGSRALREGLQPRHLTAATPQADIDMQHWAAEAERRGEALHRHHEEALDEDRHLRAEDAHLRREATVLRAAVAAQASRTAAARTGAAASAGTMPSGDAIFVDVIIALLLLAFCIGAGAKVYDDVHHQPGNENGAGTVKFADVKRALHKHFLCGLDAHGIRSLCMLLAFAITGFVFFWWKDMIQPILANLIVYAFIATVILLILGIVGGEVFQDLSVRLGQAQEAVAHVESVFHDGTKDVDDGA